MFPGARVTCGCGASQAVKVSEAKPREPVVSVPAAPASRGCPRCAAELAVRSVGGVVVAACPTAHGLFVTHATLRGVKDAPPAVVAAIDAAPSAPLDLADDDAALVCPTCGETMARRLLGTSHEVHVDVCAAHGTWFDAGELRAAMGTTGKGAPLDHAKVNATLDVALALEAARDEQTARAGIDLAEDVLDTFNVFVLGRPTLRRRY
jgi:Zn-finger nucleic acid-binding protein